MNRRNLLLVLSAIVIFAARPDRTLAQQSAARPNFLFIVTDDQRWDAMSVVQKEQGDQARFPWFTTPNMDRLAGQGVRFRNAFVVNSLCSPSRACFMSGQYNHLNGVINNHTPFSADNITHATELKKAGYVTGYFGKWHCGAQKDRPGFEVIASFVGQGEYEDCPILVNGAKTPTHGWIDDVTTEYAIKFLKERQSDGKNFDMVVGFKSPHDPRLPPERAKDRFSGEQIKPPVNADARPPYRKVNPATQAHDVGGARDRRGRGGGNLNYFRCISAADDCLGKILDALDELKMADNTVVVFTSDNGYFLGEHGLGDKRGPYDESLRIPLIVRYPKLIKPGAVNDAMILNIDYAPTILDLAQVQVPTSMQGKSWSSLFQGSPDATRARDFRNAFFYEYFYETNFNTPTVTALRTSDAKFVRYPDHDEWTELFDLVKDPHEMKNLIRDPGAADLLNRMQTLYNQQVTATKFQIPPNIDKPSQDRKAAKPDAG